MHDFAAGLRGLSSESRWAREASTSPDDIEDIVGDDPDAQMKFLMQY